MRTVEISDEVFARAQHEASERGVPVNDLINEVVDRGIPFFERPRGNGVRVSFPIFPNSPGTPVLTKEMIDAVELEDDLRRSGL